MSPRTPYSLRFSARPLTLAISLALGATATLSFAAPEQSAERTQGQAFDIPAGPLTPQLNLLASQAGIYLAGDASLSAGKSGPALKGHYPVDQALQILLASSGLEAVPTGGQRYQLQARPAAAGALELGATSISGKAPGSTTEGTGLYTTYSSSSSTRLNLTQKETPQSLTVITRQRLDDQRLNNLTEVMEATPGIAVSRVGVGAENDTYWSRGFQINNFEIDGIPTSPRLANFSQGMAMYDRVEVVRGATGLISGSGTPSATINMIRKRPTAEAQASVTVEAGSWDRYGTGMDVSGPLTDSGNVRGRLVLDYKTQNSWVDRYKQQNQLFYGITEFDLSEATLLSVGFSYLKSNADSPLRTGLQSYFSNGVKTDFKRSASSSPDWSYYDQARSNFFTSLEHRFDNGWSAKIELGHSEYRFDELINYMNGEIDQATGTGAYMFPNRWAGTPRENNLDAYVSGPFSLFGREHELITGVTLSRYRESVPEYGGWIGPWTGYDGNIGSIYGWNGKGNRPDTTQMGKSVIEENQYAAYMTTRLHVTDQTALILGGRVTDWKRSSENNGNDGSSTRNQETRNGIFLPYAGLVYDLNDTWSLYGSYTKIFNPQAYGVKDSSGKPLEPQQGTGYEVGVKGSFYDDKLNASLALFKLEQDNLAVFTGVFDTYTAEQGTTTKGLEMELNGELGEGWQASAGYAYSISTDQNDERIVTNIPRHSLKTFTSYRLPGAWDKLTVGGGVNWQSKIGQDLHQFQQGSYALTNLMARYQIDQHLSASLNVNNLFDRTYYTYADNWSVYGAPRNVMTSLKYDF
ncbi:TonB-dependent siderophore receptor [Pseudomonas sp. TH05]|uniref:TonB-dependent siderophore receptor n=1 Tax=unclassified Pseudomonas TaxID=196821 RepID=UPI001914C950|nr:MULTISPECIES: TonB-dependent siderophore receptor [unclassified Pseudomonas]MBK5537390.1 TonB-dependent siderophore receptor [Pseudomonas sp. TH07]MBK5556014.1 TonB-dependent siderophore receptor [Pseudomonas sp. TH05]